MNEIPKEIADLELYAKDERLCRELPGYLPRWHERYPRLNILEIIRDCHMWELERPLKRKVKRVQFIGNWLRGARGALPAPSEPPEARSMRKKTTKAMKIREQGEKAALEPGAKEAKARFLATIQGLRVYE